MFEDEWSIRRIAPTKVVPVAVVNETSQAVPLREALKSGGINSIEVTLRTQNALEIIKIMAEDPDFIVGAGTVLNQKDAYNAVTSGARFIVSPGIDVYVLKECDQLGVPHLPGVATASEIMQAHDFGFKVLKFFPAEALGGVPTLKALIAPFLGINFVPTGGINIKNLQNYLEVPQVVAVGGSWIVPEKFMCPDGYDKITKLTQEALNLIAEFESY